ncbi:peptidase M75 [Streptomyces sp. HNM0575]|uniref:iron uptake system protein EfeO n=1 Tax=Streptomyces sp. HNM0575 TaxID=2716338 RepID=UPI00145D556E|nr:iron uptake system protein EfeO [Streptomyces sp. HNM0575]NLU71351.1 peptidase M75 [Streptomyces sp. HNM0575]
MSASARSRTLIAGTAVPLLAAAVLTGCAEKQKAGGHGGVQVAAGDSSCKVSDTEFPAGHVRLHIENKGTKVTEVYVYAPGDRIVTERENIGPGTKADITTEVEAGKYEIACKPGMKGDGIRQKVTATGKGADRKRNPKLDAAVAGYRAYVQKQADQTVPAAQKFADAVEDGDVAEAKKRYAVSRVGWERTEPVAESFGDIDPKVDVRADGLEEGQKWTGWHKLEKSLWEEKKISAEDKKLAGKLMKDLKDWQNRVGKARITPTSMANGAKELLDEVATGKVTGEEERYSHTDLVDFEANVDGAEKAYELLKPVTEKKDAQLAKDLDEQFAAIGKNLDEHRKGDGFVSYDTVGKGDRKKLSNAVNALAEPLSRLAATVAS